jgi:fatty acid desaturase
MQLRRSAVSQTLTSKYQNRLAIDWYRTPVEPSLLRELNETSDVKGLMQSGGFLALIIASGALVVYAQRTFPWPWLIPALLLHGTFCAFMSNAVHEFVHGTVFRTPWLNAAFLDLFSFLRWFPYDYYWASHTEHRKFTLHPDADREVVLPTHFTFADFFKTDLLDPARLLESLQFNIRFARGRHERLGLPDEGIAPGTAWEDIPGDWNCPDCGTSKADFQMVELTG